MLLGIDYGLKNIGLAISEGEIAQPLSTITVKKKSSELTEIKVLVENHKIDTIIVGISEGKSKARALGFGRQLESMLQLPVEYVDETLSTAEAYSVRRKDKTKEHAKAAAIILQRYLDSK